MIAVAAFVVGAAVSTLLWTAMSRQLTSAPALRRENYRGHELPVAAGIVVVLTVILVGVVYLVAVRYNGFSPDETARQATILGGATIGYGLLGLFDDLVGATHVKGFGGHLRALARGELTTGMVKLVWGVLLGIMVGGNTIGASIRGGLVIAAAANAANLFDRAPGRAVKVGVLGAIVIAVLGAPGWWLTGPMLVIGAGVGLLVPDLRERCMIGDTGANVLGAAVGYGLLLATGPSGQWIALAVLVALNLLSEQVSFSSVIDRVPPLRWLDRLGCMPERRAR